MVRIFVFDIDRWAIVHGARCRDFVIVFKGFLASRARNVCLALAGLYLVAVHV